VQQLLHDAADGALDLGPDLGRDIRAPRVEALQLGGDDLVGHRAQRDDRRRDPGRLPLR